MRWIWAAAVLVRVALLAYGAWQDSALRVKFTDVDYAVFSDAARFVAHGESPYLRETYRYTPLLALLLAPSVWLGPLFGKVCFVVADLLCGATIERVLRVRGVPAGAATRYAALWLLNPMVFTISARGNAEALVSLAVLLAVLWLHERKVVLAGIALGVAVHLKVYPAMYAVPMYFFLDAHAFPPRPARPRTLLGDLFSRPRVVLAAVSAAVFFALGAAMYYRYGWEFVEETYLYHLTRKDHRHNFSPYFYGIYLNFGGSASTAVSLLAFLPQFLVTAAAGAAFYRDIAFCCFVQTIAFVTFNKVCTSQYFIWYITLLPLIVPWTRLTLRSFSGAALLALWIGSQAWWLSNAYQLEFEGVNTYEQLWHAALAFLAANTVVLAAFVHHQRVTPVFVAGKLVLA